MAEQGIIEPSTSPWCSPVVILRKKDSSIRFAIYFRLLNHYTVKDSHLLPRIDDTLDALSGAKWYSTLDLKAVIIRSLSHLMIDQRQPLLSQVVDRGNLLS